MIESLKRAALLLALIFVPVTIAALVTGFWQPATGTPANSFVFPLTWGLTTWALWVLRRRVLKVPA